MKKIILNGLLLILSIQSAFAAETANNATPKAQSHQNSWYMPKWVMSPKRIIQCLFWPEKYKCTIEEKKYARNWAGATTAAAIVAVAGAVGYKISIDKTRAQRNQAIKDSTAIAKLEKEIIKMQPAIINLSMDKSKYKQLQDMIAKLKAIDPTSQVIDLEKLDAYKLLILKLKIEEINQNYIYSANLSLWNNNVSQLSKLQNHIKNYLDTLNDVLHNRDFAKLPADIQSWAQRLKVSLQNELKSTAEKLKEQEKKLKEQQAQEAAAKAERTRIQKINKNLEDYMKTPSLWQYITKLINLYRFVDTSPSSLKALSENDQMQTIHFTPDAQEMGNIKALQEMLKDKNIQLKLIDFIPTHRRELREFVGKKIIATLNALP